MYPSNRIMTSANSNHPNGVNMQLCDGSGRFVSSSINLEVWRRLGSREGNEAINATDY
jgi:hypothetical protein